MIRMMMHKPIALNKIRKISRKNTAHVWFVITTQEKKQDIF